jgi:hypothetical protein
MNRRDRASGLLHPREENRFFRFAHSIRALWRTVLHSVVLAFLDGYVQGNVQALDYVRRGVVQRLSRDLIDWRQK